MMMKFQIELEGVETDGDMEMEESMRVVLSKMSVRYFC